jgi:hypothetical protein
LAFQRAVGLRLCPSVAAGLVHFVVALKGELNGIAIIGAVNGSGDAFKSELAGAFALEENAGRLDHVGEVGVVWHPDDAPFSLRAAGP